MKVLLAQRARAILQQFGIGPEHPANDVLLRRTAGGYGAPHGAPGEPNIHTIGYIEYVSRKIIDAEEDGKEAVIDALQHVGNELIVSSVFCKSWEHPDAFVIS